MKAEIGFVRDWSGDHNRSGYGALTDRLRLVVSSQSQTEQTTLMVFAKRMGIPFEECASELAIEEPAR